MTARKLRRSRWRDRPPPCARASPWGAVRGHARGRPWAHVRRAHPPRSHGRRRAPGRRRRARRARPAPARGAGPRPRRRRRSVRSHRGWVLGLRRPDRRAHGPPVGRRRPLLPGGWGGRVSVQRRAADHPCRGRVARPSWRRAGGRPRAGARRPDVRIAAVERARPLVAAGQDVPRRRLAVEPAVGRRGNGEVGRPQGRRRSGVRVARARRARPRDERCAAHGGRRAALRPRRLLPLPQCQAQPDQLERGGLRARRHHDRRHVAAASRLLPAHAPLRRGRAPAVARGPARAPMLRRLGEPRSRLSVQLPDHAAAGRRLQPRLGGVREHHRALPALVRPRTRRRDARAAARRPRRAAGLGRARAARLLDPQRLPQLGHWARPQALADRQDLRLRTAGAARHRAGRRLPCAPRVRRVGEALLRSRPRALHPVGRRGGRRHARAGMAQRCPRRHGRGR